MLKRIILLVTLIGLVSGTALAVGGDVSKRDKKIRKRAAKVEKAVRKLGVSNDSLVRLKTRDKKKIKGYISKISENGFEVTKKDGTKEFVTYQNTKKIKGNNLHAGVWVGVGVGIALVVVWTIFRSLDS